MSDAADIASVAILLGDATRSRMLALLMGGQACTATELALEGGVAASTASSHLARLRNAGLVAMVKQGRNHYFRLADPWVATLLESLMMIAPAHVAAGSCAGPADPRLRAARVCYDHLAGDAGVRLLRSLRMRGYLQGEEAIAPTGKGLEWFAGIGIDIPALKGRRPLCRTCLDWSERRDHLAGALGAALLRHMLVQRHAQRVPDSRILRLSARGERFIDTLA